MLNSYDILFKDFNFSNNFSYLDNITSLPLIKIINLYPNKNLLTSSGPLKVISSYLFYLETSNEKQFSEICNFPKIDNFDQIKIIFNKLVSKINWSDLNQILYEIEKLNSPFKFAMEILLFKFKQFSFKEIPVIKNHGLVWGIDLILVEEQIRQLYNSGYRIIKLKLPRYHVQEHLNLLTKLAAEYSGLKYRLAGNYNFSLDDFHSILKQLELLPLDTLEDFFNTSENLTNYNKFTNLPLTLDHSLWCKPGFNIEEQLELIKITNVKKIILRPALCGGLINFFELINHCKKYQIEWYLSSTLESNISLSILFNLAYLFNPRTTHGLGTGMNYSNQLNSPIKIEGSTFAYNTNFNPTEIWKL